MVAEITAGGLLVAVLLAELLHLRRVRRLAGLAFGPSQSPRLWVRCAPAVRGLGAAGLAWGLVTLLQVPPQSYRADGTVPESKQQHLILVLDVSPSMRLEDAGPAGRQTRKSRARDLVRSLLERVPTERYRISVVAVYNGAKPVVVDSKDLEVVDGILGDLPLYQAFPSGETQLLEGLREAVNMANSWNPGSATILMLSDGDTVPATGMPRLPASVRDILVVGVGDPIAGSFIDGRQSKQDAFALRQIASRLRGTYHDGNRRHIPTETIAGMVTAGLAEAEDPWGRREYALLAIAVCAAALAMLPLSLEYFGNAWLPGIRSELRWSVRS